MKHYNVVVVGGGHAGVEAADAAARMGASTALVTLSADNIGVMSCNPAIGGLGKGHLVREIDALDGIMGRAADMAGIQFRLLNRSKGAAVRGPRAQCDRKLYRLAVQGLLRDRKNLDVVEGEVTDFRIEAGRVKGVLLGTGEHIQCDAVVLTAGTFLNGLIHLGQESRPGGRQGDPASMRLAHRLRDLDLGAGRLKTGTPPRLDGTTIDWSRTEMQPGDDEPEVFSFLNSEPFAMQVACGITHTNEVTHEIIRQNLAKSAMYSGSIKGVGPRYCPSIEDKVSRFADRTAHQVFLEPEGLDVDTVYPNGISTSLPPDIQEAYVRSIVGLEGARITQYGYAIEYDYFDPRGLDGRLSVRSVEGLYFAGQINGTTGYEEAAAQGLVAGLNAALEVRGSEGCVFSRSLSYVGVMIDDLVSRGVSEPYRMFTSRAEFRLLLRSDNADQRLTPLGLSLGCISEGRGRAFAEKQGCLQAGRTLLERSLTPSELASMDLPFNGNGIRRTGLQLIGMGVSDDALARVIPEVGDVNRRILDQLRNDAVYAPYVERQHREMARLRKDEGIGIPDGFDFGKVTGLSNELRNKLVQKRPGTLAQASAMEGMTPAAVTLLYAHLRNLQPDWLGSA